jgi:zinc/manganese transport system substrate-binding protein
MPEPPPQGKKKEGEKKGDGKKAEPKAAAETHHDEHDHGDEDPHWWHSVKRTKQAVRVVRDHLTRISPTDKALFAKNAAAYEQELTALHNWVEAKVAELPKARRKLVTTHDAFGYLAADYGFTVYAVSGISTGTQPSSKAVSEMIGMIKKEGVKAVFCEDIVSPKIMARVAGESGARFGGLLLSDGLGTGAASTYVGMVKQNITTIVDALQ